MPFRRKKQKPSKHEQPSQQLDPEMSKLARGVVEIAAALHDNWRKPLRVGSDGYLPDLEETKDNKWIKTHGSDQVDIANTDFDKLPRDWQAENIAAARVVLGLLLEEDGFIGFHREGEEARVGGIIHDAWVQRHPESSSEGLDVPFTDLPWDQQDKDLNQAHIGMQVWARMKLAEQDDRGYEGDEVVTDPRTGKPISVGELLDDVHARVRQEEIIRQSETPNPVSQELSKSELLHTAEGFLDTIYEISKKWPGERNVSEHRGTKYVRVHATSITGDRCDILLIYKSGDDIYGRPRRCQVTRYYKPVEQSWPREHYIDIDPNPESPVVRETNYPYHEEDLAQVDTNTDTAVQKARHLIEQLPDYRDLAIA